MTSPADFFRTDTLPEFLIIGAQKAGTTSLASYLAEHPTVIAPKFKEVHFFDLNYARGVEWYRSQFPVSRRRRLKQGLLGRQLRAGEATPYYLFHPQAPQRCSQLLPAARIIIMLRDPVDRAYSQYHHEVRLGHESLSFEEAIAAEPSRIAGEAHRLETDPTYESMSYQHFGYLARGIYGDQIRRWLSFYPSDRVLMLSSEKFFENSAEEYKKVVRFLGLPDWEPPSYPAEHVGKYAPMARSMRERLLQYFAPHNLALRQLLNSIWPRSGDEIVNRFAS